MYFNHKFWPQGIYILSRIAKEYVLIARKYSDDVRTIWLKEWKVSEERDKPWKCYIAQACLELKIQLLPPKGWHYKGEPPHLGSLYDLAKITTLLWCLLNALFLYALRNNLFSVELIGKIFKPPMEDPALAKRASSLVVKKSTPNSLIHLSICCRLLTRRILKRSFLSQMANPVMPHNWVGTR